MSLLLIYKYYFFDYNLYNIIIYVIYNWNNQIRMYIWYVIIIILRNFKFYYKNKNKCSFQVWFCSSFFKMLAKLN